MLESAYLRCLAHELKLRGLTVEQERPLPITYKGIELDCGYKVDLLVENLVVVELKAVEKIHPVHEAQLLPYLRLGSWTIGLLLNFNVKVLKDGFHRRVLGHED